jgi:hypothetical protein
MIVPCIVGAVGENPGIPYHLLWKILKPYANDYVLTNSILQEGWELAKTQLYGQADDNVQYAKGVVKELQGLGHHVQILYANREEILQAVCGLALHEEITHLKKEKQTTDREEQLKFVQ